MKTRSNYSVIKKLERTLIVSCQADIGEPLASPEHIKALALSAIKGGAKGLRLEGTENIKAVKAVSDLPIIGLSKSKNVSNDDRPNKVYITASFLEAKDLSDAGSDIIALDATDRPRADNLSLEETISRIHKELDKPVWADISTFDEGVQAHKYGADIISTTLYGYTQETQVTSSHGPDLDLLKKLVDQLDVPIILEGRVWYPEQVAKAFEYGSFAVVVGSAITRPHLITERFVKAIPK
jgi:putative N-acetylmannosamine-6-phosphate epimerase